MQCLRAPLEATQEADGLSRAKQGRAGPEACHFRSIYMGGKLLPDLAWNNVPLLHLFASLLPLVKLSEPLNFRQRRSVWFSCSCSKGFAVGPESCVPTTCPIRGVPRALWERALHPAARREGAGVWGTAWGPPANPYQGRTV